MDPAAVYRISTASCSAPSHARSRCSLYYSARRDVAAASRGRRGGRTYDRQSGAGRGREVRKGGAGGSNWGNSKREAEMLSKNRHADDALADVASSPLAAADGSAVPVEVVEDTRTTFSEYMAGLNLTAGAGKSAVEADAELKKAKVHNKAETFEFEPGFEGTKKAKKAKKSTSTKKFVDPSLVGVTIGEEEYVPRERTERGGRGGSRGGRGGRGGSRGGRGGARTGGAPRQQLSAAAFPSLSASK